MLVSKDKKYFAYSYEGKEQELLQVVEEKATEIFGEYSFFIPKKKLYSNKSKLGSIPDGFLLDLSDPDNPTLYVVEVELKGHGLEHIATQILKFAISYRETKPKLNRFILDLIRSDKTIKKEVENRLKESQKYDYLDQLIDAAMDDDVATVIVPIDGIEESLKEVQKYISVPITYISIKSYVNTESGEVFHQFTPLYQEEEAAKIPPVGTYYYFLIENVELINIPRSQFDEENNISKHAQGYTFVRDKTGKSTGVIFWWYKSRAERHIKEEVTEDKKSWAATRRPVDPESYEIGMDVYMGETFWDGDTGRKIDDPRYIIKGQLKEIYRVDGDKKTRIFPIEFEEKK